MSMFTALDLMQGMHSVLAKAAPSQPASEPQEVFAKSFPMLLSFRAKLAKGDKPGHWFCGNAATGGATSIAAKIFADKVAEARSLSAAGLNKQARIAEQEAAARWKKMGTSERQYAMKLVHDSAAEDIAKERDRGFEYGHGRRLR